MLGLRAGLRPQGGAELCPRPQWAHLDSRGCVDPCDPPGCRPVPAHQEASRICGMEIRGRGKVGTQRSCPECHIGVVQVMKEWGL